MSNTNMTLKELQEAVYNHPQYFLQHLGEKGIGVGWKLSIQGTGKDDLFYLVEKLCYYLIDNKFAFKYGTKILMDITGDREEQSHKLLTIYTPFKTEEELKEFAETIYKMIENYTGGEGIIPTGYTHYKGAIFYRTDRDENGNYVYPY